MDKRPLVNYHTHTWRCRHAEGADAQYVEQALASGFALLGFSDHTPWPYKSDFISGVRMRMDQLQDYLDTVNALRRTFAGRIDIPVGLECEAFPEFYGWLGELKARSLDYLILGNHYDLTDDGDPLRLTDAGGFRFGRSTRPQEVLRYAQRTIAGMNTGLFDFVAHPDLYCRVYPAFDAECAAAARDICAAAEALNLPLEYNLLGLWEHRPDGKRSGLGYPCPGFWEIAAQYRVKAIVGFDVHDVVQLTWLDLWREAVDYLQGLGIEVLPWLPGLSPTNP